MCPAPSKQHFRSPTCSPLAVVAARAAIRASQPSHTGPWLSHGRQQSVVARVCAYIEIRKAGQGLLQVVLAPRQQCSTLRPFNLTRGSSVVAQTSICLPSACLRASSSRSGLSGDAFAPFFIHCVHITRARRPTGARASHHHQANVKPYCNELTLVVRRRCRCSCRNLASDVAAAERSDCAARAVDDSWRPIVERLARDSFASTVGMPCNARRKVRPPCRSP